MKEFKLKDIFLEIDKEPCIVDKYIVINNELYNRIQNSLMIKNDWHYHVAREFLNELNIINSSSDFFNEIIYGVYDRLDEQKINNYLEKENNEKI